MSTPNPTHIIAEHWYMFIPVAGVTNIECDCGKFRVAGPYSINEMRALHAAHVVSKLTDAGYSIVSATPGTCVVDPMGTHRWVPFYSIWRCADCQLKRPKSAATERETP